MTGSSQREQVGGVGGVTVVGRTVVEVVSEEVSGDSEVDTVVVRGERGVRTVVEVIVVEVGSETEAVREVGSEVETEAVREVVRRVFSVHVCVTLLIFFS